jgi:formylglycine-generating enzyme required for sulfatase activity
LPGGRRGLYRGRPTAVRSFAANAFGLHDMHGNLWEWTQDDYCPYPPGPATDPVARCGVPLKVIRGGSWAFDADSARCALRYTHRAQDSGYSLGFRLVYLD